MGLFKSSEFATENCEVFHKPTDDCFLCGDKLTGGVWIYWQGFGAQVWLHPACAKRLGDHLCSDWEKFKRAHPELL